MADWGSEHQKQEMEFFFFYFCFVELGVPLIGILRRWLYMVCNTSVKGYY